MHTTEFPMWITVSHIDNFYDLGGFTVLNLAPSMMHWNMGHRRTMCHIIDSLIVKGQCMSGK